MNVPAKSTCCALLLTLFAACGGGGSTGNGDEPPPAPPDGGPGIPPSAIEPGVLGDGRLERIVARVRERHDLPAMGAILVADGVVVETAVDGLRSVDGSVEVGSADRWHLGSVTKSMTATLAAILVERSLLSWDTTPAEVWPADVSGMHPAYRDVTLAQLLAHQAGLQPDIGLIPSIDLTRDDRPGTVVDKRRLWARELLQLNPANAIGEFNYGNAGYIVVGSMLETVGGSTWESLMTNNVFGPLGMTDTGFRAPGTVGQLDQPWGHWERSGRLVSIPPGPGADSQQAIGPAGNVHTTLHDYALYMFAHLEGELGIPGLVSADTYRFLHEPLDGEPYALGWNVDNRHAWARGPLLFHFGTNLRWVASAGIIPGLNTGMLIVANSGTENAVDAANELSALLLNRVSNSQ